MSRLLVVGVQEASRRHGTHSYHNRVNLHDPNMILLVFRDLENYGAPIKKAIELYLSEEKKPFPL